MAANPLKYRLKYVGGVPMTNVKFLHIKDGTNDRVFTTETVAEVEAITFTSNGDPQDITLESMGLFVIEFITNPTITNVTGHLSTYKDNWVDANKHFSFGDYYGSTSTISISLGGAFHIRDGNFHTLNEIFRDFSKIKVWDANLFRDYKNGNDLSGTPIVGLKQTFKNNSALNDIPLAMMQYLPHLETIRECWMNTSLTTIRPNQFAYQNKIRDAFDAFANCKITNLPPRVIAIVNTTD